MGVYTCEHHHSPGCMCSNQICMQHRHAAAVLCLDLSPSSLQEGKAPCPAASNALQSARMRLTRPAFSVLVPALPDKAATMSSC